MPTLRNWTKKELEDELTKEYPFVTSERLDKNRVEYFTHKNGLWQGKRSLGVFHKDAGSFKPKGVDKNQESFL